MSIQELQTLSKAIRYGVVPNSTSDEHDIAYSMLDSGLLEYSKVNTQVLVASELGARLYKDILDSDWR